jgi:hypothetical protein
MGGRPQVCLDHSPTLGRVPNEPNLIHGLSAQNKVTQHRWQKSFGTKIVTAEESNKIYPWGWIRWKLDLISFPKSARTSQSESVWSRIHHKLVLSCSPNPVGANPLPFWSSPSFLSKTRVHASPLSKYDGQEFKNELTWWLSWGARARVIGPSGAGAGVGVGVGVGVVLMSSSDIILVAPDGTPRWHTLHGLR